MALRPAFEQCGHCRQFALASDPESRGGRGRKCLTCGARVYPERAAVQMDFDGAPDYAARPSKYSR